MMSYFILQTLFLLLLSFILGLILGRWLKRLLCNRTESELQAYPTENKATTTTYSGTADKLAFRDRGEHTTKTNERPHASTKTAAAGIATAAVTGAVSHSLSSSDDKVKTEDIDEDIDIEVNRVDTVDEVVEIEQFDDITIDTDISHDESITIDTEIATDIDNDADIAKAETRQAEVNRTWEDKNDKNIDETTSTDYTTEPADDEGLLLKSAAALGTAGVAASIATSSDEGDEGKETEEASAADSEIIDEDSTNKTTDILDETADETVEKVIVTKSTISGLDSDNLQIIEGIGPKMQKILHTNGIHDWKALSLKSESDLRDMLDQYDDRYKGVENLDSWVSQAKLAADGDIDELIRVQKVDGISKVENKFGITGSGKSSNIKADISKSVDSKADAATSNNESASEASSKNIAGSDTTSEKSNIDKSDASETTTDVSISTESPDKESIPNKDDNGTSTENNSAENNSAEASGSNTEASSDNPTLSGVAAAITSTAAAHSLMGSTGDSDNNNADSDSSSQTNGVRSQANSTSSKGSGIPGIDSNENLQIIEGIGPAMEKVLKENGINNWHDLGSKSETDVQAILNSYGDKYKLMQPARWITEAKLAAIGNVAELIRIQKVDGISKLEKLMGANNKSGFAAYQSDDLQIVEGIGPKIAELLNRSGINTWKALANADEKKLQGILDAAGSDFQVANPSTWAEQAGLADKGEWADLKKYQDFLDESH